MNLQYFISHYNKETELTFPEDITIYDTTLRDGEQTPGVCFSLDEKLEIARKLDQFKIHQIEAGFPIVSEKERESVKTIANEGLDATILGLTRTKTEDIDAALDCDVDGIITFVGTSDIHLDHKMHITRQDAINLSETAVEYAKDHGLFVAFSAEDATRTDIEFLKRIYGKAQECGADRVHIADTTGAITPQGIDYLVKELVKDIDIDIAVHLHNDFGLAVINSIVGVLAGAKAVSTTVNGIGERAGNASLEELIMAMKILYGKDYGFRHESGIHVDAVIEEPLCYEPYLPELVGQKRQLVLGKHSGCRAVRAKLNECELDVSNDELIEIVRQVKKQREEGKYINDQVFKEIVKNTKK